MEPLVQVRNVHKTFFRGGEKIDVLQGLDVDVAQGEFLALMGPSGSGKSTLLNLIGGLDQATAGSIVVGGVRISELAGGKLTSWRARHIGFVFQVSNLLRIGETSRSIARCRRTGADSPVMEWTPPATRAASMCQSCWASKKTMEESTMEATLIAVDLAKNVFEIAVSERPGIVTRRRRVRRAHFLEFFAQHAPATVAYAPTSSATRPTATTPRV